MSSKYKLLATACMQEGINGKPVEEQTMGFLSRHLNLGSAEARGGMGFSQGPMGNITLPSQQMEDQALQESGASTDWQLIAA